MNIKMEKEMSIVVPSLEGRPLQGCIQDYCEGGSNLVNGSSFSTFHHNFLKFPYENEMIGCKWGSSVPPLHLTVFIVKHVLYKTLSL